MSEKELEEEAKGLKTLLVPDLVACAEVDGKIVGTMLCIPDFNPAIRKIKGRLFPFGFLEILKTKRKFHDIRAVCTSVLP